MKTRQRSGNPQLPGLKQNAISIKRSSSRGIAETGTSPKLKCPLLLNRFPFYEGVPVYKMPRIFQPKYHHSIEEIGMGLL